MAENNGKTAANGNGNLRPFPKGTSGNPKGRPRGSISIVHLIRRVLKEPCDVAGANGRTWAEVLGRSLIANAIKGNGTAIKQLLDRLEGPVVVPDRADQNDTEPLRELVSAMKEAASADIQSKAG